METMQMRYGRSLAAAALLAGLFFALAGQPPVFSETSLLSGSEAPAASVSCGGTLWRLDNEDRSVLPRNFRTVRSAFRPVPARYAPEMDTAYVPTRKGLDGLRISGSSQFSEKQLTEVIRQLRPLTQGPVYIVDLRQESHGFVNGLPVSWYGERNWANRGETHRAVLADERQRLDALRGKVVTITRLGKKEKDRSFSVRADTVLTEQELTARQGLLYARFTNTDHVWPAAEELDSFLRFVRSLPADAWLHFHCEAGEGRTTAYMTMYDMLRNPDVPYKDIVYRQCLIGGVYTPYLGKGKKSWRRPYYAEKKKMLRLFYQYVQENRDTGYAVSWSAWLARRGSDGSLQ